MFTSTKVGCYLNGFAGHGDDPESKELKLVFHISPITPELAIEISPHLADRIFRSVGGQYEPVKEMPKASFAPIQVPMQNIAFFSLPEGKENGVVVENAAISNLRVSRAFPTGLEPRLEFDVVIPMDKETMRLVEKYYKATCFLTMDEVQRQIEYSEDSATGASLQEVADAEEPAMETVPPGDEEPKKKRGRKAKGAE